jgi:hypothetical protein
VSHRRGSGKTGTSMQLVRLRSSKSKPRRSLRSQMKADERYSARMLRKKFGNRPMEDNDTQA